MDFENIFEKTHAAKKHAAAEGDASSMIFLKSRC